MLPFPPPESPPSAAEAPSPSAAQGPATLGATPERSKLHAPDVGSMSPTNLALLAAGVVVAVGAAAGLGWFLLRKKPGSEARLENPSAGAVGAAEAVDEAPPPAKRQQPVFTLDDDPETFTLTEFLDNNEHLDMEDLEKIEVMKVGDEHALGGGAWARFVLKRVS